MIQLRINGQVRRRSFINNGRKLTILDERKRETGILTNEKIKEIKSQNLPFYKFIPTQVQTEQMVIHEFRNLGIQSPIISIISPVSSVNLIKRSKNLSQKERIHLCPQSEVTGTIRT